MLFVEVMYLLVCMLVFKNNQTRFREKKLKLKIFFLLLKVELVTLKNQYQSVTTIEKYYFTQTGIQDGVVFSGCILYSVILKKLQIKGKRILVQKSITKNPVCTDMKT